MDEFISEHGKGIVAAAVGASLLALAVTVFSGIDLLHVRQLILLYGV